MRVISYETYQEFAKRYKIPLLNKKKKKPKSMKQLSKEIYEYEKTHDDITNGLYFI